MANTRYTPDLLAPLVKDSVSYSEVPRRLGKRWSGGLQNHLVARIAQLGLDTSHFLGQAANQGQRHKSGPVKRSSEAILVTRTSGRREKTRRCGERCSKQE